MKPGNKIAITHVEIERVMKSFRCHRCAIDFDSGFVNMVVKTTGGDNFWTKKDQARYMARVESDDEGDEDLFELPDPSDSESETDDEME